MTGIVLNNISDCYVGNNHVKEIWYSSTKIWPAAHDYSQDYLTIECVRNSCDVRFITSDASYITRTIYYSDDGVVWQPFTSEQDNNTAGDGFIRYLHAGDKLYIKGTNSTYADTYHNAHCNLRIEDGVLPRGNTKIYGNIMSLVYGDNFIGQTTLSGSFESFFYHSDDIIDASNLILPATTLTNACYNGMFSMCGLLTMAPKLPATTLASSCYANMFEHCGSLTTAPELPVTTLTTSCYTGMFSDCYSLVNAPELPATTLTPYCYSAMFADCFSLVNAPELPATTLATNCYDLMFRNCTSLTTAPELPATTLADYCYEEMFDGCTSLTTAPLQLPATTLADYCYANMFSGCTSLVEAPYILADTLDDSCCAGMYYGCTSLMYMNVPWADTLVFGCYESMFAGCTSLESAYLPEIVTTLAQECCSNMYEGCTSILTAQLPAADLVSGCYEYMFTLCSSLEEITCLATNISAQDALTGWVDGVAQQGTFYKDRNTTWTTGTSGIPTGWTVVDVGELPYDEQYFTFEVTDENNPVTFSFTRNNLEYSTDDGQTWSTLTTGSSTPQLILGEKILWRQTGINPGYNAGIGRFSSTGQFKVYGNVMSLYYGNNFTNQTSLSGKTYAFYGLFGGCTYLIDATNLILPATTLSNYCYSNMFASCTSLTTAPELPATTLVSNCYNYMFQSCTSLTSMKVATLTMNSNYTYYWVQGVASSGTYYKNSSATYTNRGTSAIPQNWTVVDYTP